MSAGICPPFPRPPFPYTPPRFNTATAPVAVRASLRRQVGIEAQAIELKRRAAELEAREDPNT